MNGIDLAQDHVQVVVRARPIQNHELDSAVCVSCLANGKSIQIKNRKNSIQSRPSKVSVFNFDACFDGRTTQEELYQRCKIADLVKSAVAGYSATIFAFGQTGAGKTYTTLGPRINTSFSGARSVQTQQGLREDGVLLRALHDAFQALSSKPTDQPVQTRVSCFEIYNESITDLLAETPSRRKNPLPVKFHANSEVFTVEGLVRSEVHDEAEALHILSKALALRQTRANSINDKSSRSHCISTIHFESTVEGRRIYGKFSVVDLAGSERLKGTGSFDRRAILETKAINKSLFTLGQVLWAVRCTSRGRLKEAPYRESKLTQVLWDSIRGEGRTLMIACCTPFQMHLDETVNTLKYASTAIRIKSTPRLILDPRERLIEDLQREIKRLKRENLQLNQTVKQLQREQKNTFPSGCVLDQACNPSCLEPETRLLVSERCEKDWARLPSREDFNVGEFPELESLEAEFQNNLTTTEPSSTSSRSTPKDLKPHDGEIKMDEIEKPSRQSVGSKGKLSRKKRSEEDFRVKIIEDLNRTKEQIQKQREQLILKLQKQMNKTPQWS